MKYWMLIQKAIYGIAVLAFFLLVPAAIPEASAGDVAIIINKGISSSVKNSTIRPVSKGAACHFPLI